MLVCLTAEAVLQICNFSELVLSCIVCVLNSKTVSRRTRVVYFCHKIWLWFANLPVTKITKACLSLVLFPTAKMVSLRPFLNQVTADVVIRLLQM